MPVPQAPGPVEDDPVTVGQYQTDTPLGVTLTSAAVAKVTALLAREGGTGLRLRLAVQPGGCSGLRYQLYFDDRLSDSDTVTRYGDVGPSPQDHLPPGPGQGHQSGHGE
jgi:hypothetical protein